MAYPLTVTGTPGPTFGLANAALASSVARLTSSPLTTPFKVAVPFNCAFVVPSYTLETAVTPLTVNPAAVMFAVTFVGSTSV